MPQMVADFLKGKALCYQMHCAGVAQCVRSSMHRIKSDICHASTDNIVKAAYRERFNGCFKRKEYLVTEILWSNGS